MNYFVVKHECFHYKTYCDTIKRKISGSFPGTSQTTIKEKLHGCHFKNVSKC